MEILMTMVSTNEPVLTQDEAAVVRRFRSVLADMGVQSALVSAVLLSTPHAKAGAENFGVALRDVLSTEPDEMEQAGVSLEIVVDVARVTEVFPEDFVPSGEIVQKCLEGFWAAARQRADADI
jgi:hypothetical protein